ncbi:MAG: hypothetical protein ABIL76_06325 [candidate division WOR-3 bacterium]
MMMLLFLQINKAVEIIKDGKVDWSKGIITAKGYGVFDVNSKNLNAEILKAQRVAVVVAQRNLLETIKGVYINSETIVEDYMLKSDLIISRVNGLIRGARMIGEPKIDKQNGIVEVEMAIDLYGDNSLASAILPEILKNTKKPKIDDIKDNPNFSALVLDGSGKDIKPSLFPKIYDENGNLIFDTAWLIDENNPSAKKVITFVENLNDILNDPELKNNPLVIKIKSVLNGRDIVVDKDNANKIKWIKKAWEIGKKIVLTLF